MIPVATDEMTPPGGYRTASANTKTLQGGDMSTHHVAAQSVTSAEPTPAHTAGTSRRAARLAAYERAGALGSALRAMRVAPGLAHVTPAALAAVEAEYKAVSDTVDELFEHASFCTGPVLGDRCSHCCIGGDSAYIEGVPRLPGDSVPSISAVAWSSEESGDETVCIHLLVDGDSDGAEGWFSPTAARALAVQLTTAADLVDGGAR